MKRIPKQSKLPSGFTLIELLVVITIIAILAAILFPVFASVRDKARQTKCSSNMKQFGLAWLQYSQDYDEMTVPLRFTTSTTQYYLPIRKLVDPYVKNSAIYVCPSETNSQVQLSYSYNWCAAFNCGGTGYHSMAQFDLPSQVPAFAESGGTIDPNASLTFYVTYYTWGRKCVPGDATNYPWASATPKMIQHQDGSNLIYADGHVKWSHYQKGVFILDTPSYSGAHGWYKSYTTYVKNVLSEPAFIGCHWFQLYDEPTTEKTSALVFSRLQTRLIPSLFRQRARQMHRSTHCIAQLTLGHNRLSCGRTVAGISISHIRHEPLCRAVVLGYDTKS